MKITLLGVGMGHPDTLTLAGKQALLEADAVLGARRMLDSLPTAVTAPQVEALLPREIVAAIDSHPQWRQVCVAYSGDIGFYSGARGLRTLLEGSAHTVQSICGITTVQYLAGQLGRPWQDLHLVSGHGVDCNLLGHLLNHEHCFFLTGGSITPAVICQTLCQAGLPQTRVTVGERLSYPDEQITAGTAQELAGREFPSLSAVIVDRDTPTFCRVSRAGGIPDEEFVRGAVPMTKREVRSVILSLLAPAPDAVIYDVGAGTGSVAVELALAARWGRVYGVEQNPEGCALIAQNRAKFGAYNLTCVEGMAPDACCDLPPPAAAFVGGTGGEIENILRLLMDKNPQVRVVISAVTLETLSQGLAALERLGFADPQVCQVSVSRTQQLGGSRLLKGQNPIFLMSGGGTP